MRWCWRRSTPRRSSICSGGGSLNCRDRGTVTWTKGDASMDLHALPFDPDTMLAGLREWVECESPTFDAAAVNRMMDLASRALVLAGARIERIAGRMGFGDCVRASFPHATPNVPGILVMGHLDTVHPIGTQLPF